MKFSRSEVTNADSGMSNSSLWTSGHSKKISREASKRMLMGGTSRGKMSRHVPCDLVRNGFISFKIGDGIMHKQ